MKFNQKNRIASKKSTALIDGSAKGVFKASGSMSFTGTTSVPLPPAPPPLVPVVNVTTAGSDGQGNVSGSGSTVSKTTKSCLSALLAAHTNDKKDLVQGSVEQEKRVSVTIPGSESTLKDQRLLKPPGSGQSSSVSSSSEGECEAEDATAVLGADTESKTKGIAHREHVNCIQYGFGSLQGARERWAVKFVVYIPFHSMMMVSLPSCRYLPTRNTLHDACFYPFRFSIATNTDRRVESTLSWKGNIHACLLVHASLCVYLISLHDKS